MFQTVAAYLILAVCYLCLTIIVFSPTLYIVWFYLISQEDRARKKGILRTTIMVFCFNAAAAYVLFKLVVDLLVPSMLARKDAVAMESLQSAVVAQQNHFDNRRHYYSVGPVKGPYKDEFGLDVKKDVVLQVDPVWDKGAARDSYEAHAVNIWGSKVLFRTRDGRIAELPTGTDEASGIRSKMLRSVE